MSHLFEHFLFQLLKSFLLLLPLKSVQRLGASLGEICYFLVKNRRVIALDNLRSAFPEKSSEDLKKIAVEAFRNYGIAIMEFLWFPNLTEKRLREVVQITNLNVFLDCFKRGKGVVALSAHFGNWELNALAVGFAGGFPTSVVVQTQSNKYVDKVINAHRTMFGNRIVPMGISVREIIRALQKSEVVALAADQSGPQEGPFTEFFKRMTATHQGPAVFVARTGAAMILTLAIRQPDGKYLSIIEEVPTADLIGQTEENVLELTRRHTRMLENYIRQYPGQWLWMHRRWKHSKDEQGRTLINGVPNDA